MSGTPRGGTLEEVLRSCRAVLQGNPHVSVDEGAADQLAEELVAADVRAASRGSSFPVKFENLQAEVNFLALYHLLDFGSGYDVELQAQSRRDAKETMQFGAIGIFLSQSEERLDSRWMKALSPYNVHNLFGIEAMVDTELQPGITISKPGPLHPLVHSILKVVRDAGVALEAIGASSLGEYVMSFLEDKKANRRPLLAGQLVRELGDTIPGFQDKAVYEGKEVLFYRKAQNLVLDLAQHFARGEKADARFAFEDLHQLTGDSGSTVPAVLRTKGVINYADELTLVFTNSKDLPPGPQEVSIRAAAVVAVSQIVGSRRGETFAATDLSAYLETLAEPKPGEQDMEPCERDMSVSRRVQKHHTKGVVAY